MTSDPPTGEVTRILERLEQGEPGALDQLVPLLYDELRRLARRQMRGERAGHTLDTTALVNEAYLRLRREEGLPSSSRASFFAAASQTMRRVLIDSARSRKRLKRGSDQVRVPFEEAKAWLTERQADEILALEEALGRLAKIDSRASRVVEHRFFGGLPLAESAALLGVSEKTVRRSWTLARAWLRREISQDIESD